MHTASLGLDFGTESVRAIIISLDGEQLALAEEKYPHGQILDHLPNCTNPLPAKSAHQHPADWLDSAAKATRTALSQTTASIIGIGVDFTSCTMLPVLRDGTPLCFAAKFKSSPQAWPKLWKHHGAIEQATRMTRIARERNEPFLKRYGGLIGEEWLLPKILETLETAPEVAAAAEVWLEAGDWFVWQLVGQLSRSTCQAGYKGLWSAAEGYPPHDYLAALHPELSALVETKLTGEFIAPGCPAGTLTAEMASRFGLPRDTPVSAAIIDAHAGVPGSGASEPDTLVMVMGTSSCHMLNSHSEHEVPGVAGIVKDGILPGFFGYETGQAAVGDAFDWLRRLTGQADFSTLSKEAAALPPGAEGVRCLDWFNGCRTPHMNAALTGSFTGLSLHHGPAHLHRALMEASACGVRWIVELLRENGVPVRKFIATGGLPHHDPALVQIYADVLGETIQVPSTTQGPAGGAAILGALAAGQFPTAKEAIQKMTSQATLATYSPSNPEAYHAIYEDYRQLASQQS
ncbi:MAG: ribulokinase [Akkermansiaceae bacterium]|jgi:L-ribulokinase